MRSWFQLAVRTAFAAAAAWGLRAAEPAVFSCGNGKLRADFIDFESSSAGRELGYRFMRPGWIRRLYLAGQPESVVRTTTLFDYHPAFGFAQEITPALKLSDGRCLQLGVGLFRPHSGSIFYSVADEVFAWRRLPLSGKPDFGFRAVQDSGEWDGYAYELTVEVRLEPDEPVIDFVYVLRNTGARRIEARAYAHPFFTAAPGLERSWYRLPRQPGTVDSGGRRWMHRDIVQEVLEPPGPAPLPYAVVEAGNTSGPAYRATISTARPIVRSQLWHNNLDCFAVEPFIDVAANPGEVFSWNWRLRVEPDLTDSKR